MQLSTVSKGFQRFSSSLVAIFQPLIRLKTLNMKENTSDLTNDAKIKFWQYQFAIEYVPSEDETLITVIFDRMNRNVAKLSTQELRHAKLDGIFITETERLTEWMIENLPRNFPNIPDRYRRQMKDVEFVALLLLFLEQGPTSYSQLDLDREFTNRDGEWEAHADIVASFTRIIEEISALTTDALRGAELVRSRLRNQADFYSLFGAMHELLNKGHLPPPAVACERLLNFLNEVGDQEVWAENPAAAGYFHAARSASNDPGPRRTRINILKDILVA
jgi:hypothetical protein